MFTQRLNQKKVIEEKLFAPKKSLRKQVEEIIKSQDVERLAQLMEEIKSTNQLNLLKDPHPSLSLLTLAAEKPNEKIAEMLVGYGIKDCNEQTLKIIARHRSIELMKLIIQECTGPHETGKIPLYSAILAGRQDMVNFLLDEGADCNSYIPSKNFSPSMLCTAMLKQTKPEIIETLIARGADIDAPLYEIGKSIPRYPEERKKIPEINYQINKTSAFMYALEHKEFDLLVTLLGSYVSKNSYDAVTSKIEQIMAVTISTQDKEKSLSIVDKLKEVFLRKVSDQEVNSKLQSVLDEYKTTKVPTCYDLLEEAQQHKEAIDKIIEPLEELVKILPLAKFDAPGKCLEYLKKSTELLNAGVGGDIEVITQVGNTVDLGGDSDMEVITHEHLT